MRWFRTYELFLGVFLTVAVFAMGFVVASSQYPRQATEAHSSEEANGDAAKKDPPKPFWQAAAADPVAAFTLGLLIVGVFQAGFFFVQLKLIRERLIDTKKAAQAAGEAAESTKIQAIVARDTLANVQRPYLFIFNVSPLAIDEKSPVGNLRVFITYTVANYGAAPAIVISAAGTLSVGTEPQLPLRFEYDHRLIIEPVFAPSERRDDIDEGLSAFNFQCEGDDIVPTLEALEDLYLWIHITYRGPFSDQHETLVCWRWDGATRRFIGPHGGDECNREK
jgi:hypothetical protein